VSWQLWRDGAHAPPWNMAVDEALLGAAVARPLLRLYGWDRPAVSLGYFQAADMAPPGYAVVRRPTGGGLVYHDHDLTFTLLLPRDHAWAEGPRRESYRRVNAVLRDALAALGVQTALAAADTAPADPARLQCFTTPARHDVLAPQGKLVGGAQRRSASGLLHQGSADCRLLAEALRAALPQAVVDAFATAFGSAPEPFALPPDAEAAAAELVQRKYATEAWNRRR